MVTLQLACIKTILTWTRILKFINRVSQPFSIGPCNCTTSVSVKYTHFFRTVIYIESLMQCCRVAHNRLWINKGNWIQIDSSNQIKFHILVCMTIDLMVVIVVVFLICVCSRRPFVWIIYTHALIYLMIILQWLNIFYFVCCISVCMIIKHGFCLGICFLFIWFFAQDKKNAPVEVMLSVYN